MKKLHYIYKITNKLNNKIYIGKSVRVKKRWKFHITNKGKYHYSLINLAIRKYGKDNFNFEVIDSTTEDKVYILENFYIQQYNSLSPNGYNLVLSLEGKLIPSKESLVTFGNAQQRRTRPRKNKYIGVRKNKRGKLFTTTVFINKKIVHKSFDTEELAAEAYDKVSLYLHGKDSLLNFPEKIEKYLNSDLEEFYNFYIKRIKVITNKYKRVSFYKNIKKWRVRFEHPDPNIKTICLGYFDSEVEAAEKSDMAILYLGLKGKINFPEKIKYYLSLNLKEIFKDILKKRENKPKSSQYHGVSFCKTSKRWISYYNKDGIQKIIGGFSSEEEAFLARKKFLDKIEKEYIVELNKK